MLGPVGFTPALEPLLGINNDGHVDMLCMLVDNIKPRIYWNRPIYFYCMYHNNNNSVEDGLSFEDFSEVSGGEDLAILD